MYPGRFFIELDEIDNVAVRLGGSLVHIIIIFSGGRHVEDFD